MRYLKEFIYGFIIGIANIIPGISGGTFALILGVFEPLMQTLNQLNSSLIKSFLNNFFKSKNKIYFTHSFLKEKNFYFLFRIGAGAITAIITFSAFISFLIENHFQATYAFFFGLIVVSILVPLRLITKWNFSSISVLILSAFLVIALVYFSDSTQQITEKSTLLKASIDSNAINFAANSFNIRELLFIVFCGTIAISAMILPGLSGSLVLLILGKYALILNAVYCIFKFQFNLEEIIVLSTFISGLVIGLITFTRIFSFILKKYHNLTMSALTGLVIGSLYSLWPYKHQVTLVDIYQKINGKISFFPKLTINTNINRLPESNEMIIPFLCMILAGIIMTFFLRKDTEKHKLR